MGKAVKKVAKFAAAGGVAGAALKKVGVKAPGLAGGLAAGLLLKKRKKQQAAPPAAAAKPAAAPPTAMAG